MLKSINLWLFTIFYILYHTPELMRIKLQKNKFKKRELAHDFIYKYTNHAIKIMGAKIELHNEHYLKEVNDGNLFVANHNSILDPYFVSAGINHFFSFFIAYEFSYIKKIPIFKETVLPMENVFVNRDNIRQSVKAINFGNKNLNDNLSQFVFPEGEITHLISDDLVGEFKNGVFKMALKAKKDIVPIAIIGSSNIQRKVSMFGKITSGTVQLHVCKPVKYEDIKNLDTNEISKIVREQIYNTIKNNIRGV